MRWSAAAWMLLFALPRARAYAQAGPIYRAAWWDAASVGAAGALFVLPMALALPQGPPSCAPCDPTTVPTLDRSGPHTFSDGAGTASSVVLAGVAGLTAFASLQGLPARQARGNFAMLANAAAWTAASSEWLKVVIRRKRPVLYTSGAAAAAADRENQESLPSGHASLAFAAAKASDVVRRAGAAPASAPPDAECGAPLRRRGRRGRAAGGGREALSHRRGGRGGAGKRDRLARGDDPPEGAVTSMRNAECGVRSFKWGIHRQATCHSNSAFRVPHSTFRG